MIKLRSATFLTGLFSLVLAASGGARAWGQSGEVPENITHRDAGAQQVARAGEAKAPTGQTMSADRYLDWKPAETVLSSPTGRVFATQGSLIYGIGGLGVDGAPVAEVEICERRVDGSFAMHKAALSRPLAYAAAVGHGGRIYVLGGLEAGGPVARVFSLEWANGALIERELPSLPSPRVLAGAAVHRSTTRYYLFALGGTPSIERPEALAEVWELLIDGAASNGDGNWRSVADLPQGGRIAPMAIETFNEIVVAGGYGVDGDGRLEPTTDVSGYARIPRDGQEAAGWRHREAMKTPIAQSAFSRSGQSHIIFVGGNAAGGAIHEVFGKPGGEGLQRAMRTYHALTDTWLDLGEMPGGAEGGALLPVGDNAFFLCGARGADGGALPGAEVAFKRSTRNLQFLDYVVLALYFLVMIGQGLWFALKKKTVETYAVGGGNMKWWATAVSMVAAGVSSISFMAIPALVASMGPVAMAGALMIIPGTLVNAYITFPMLRRLKVVSVFEYLEQRFDTTLRLLGSFKAIVTTLLGRIGIVILLPSLAISSMTGLDPVMSILAIGLVTTIYSALGGFEGVVWTDFLQGLLLFGGFILLGILAFQGVPGGIRGVVDTAATLERNTFFIFSPNPVLPSIWFIVLGAVLTMMSFPADQSLAQRVLATPLRDVRRFAFSVGALSLLVAVLTLFIGMCLLAYFRATPAELSPVMKNDQLVPLFMVHKLPVGVVGFILAAIFAASMSTVASGVNSCAVMFAEDFYRRLFKRSNPAREVWVMRIGTVITGLLGTASALWLVSMPMPTLWETFMRIMALLGGGFGGVFILGFVTQRANGPGTLAGVLVSMAVAYLLQFRSLDVHWSALGSLITLSCVVVGYVASLLIPAAPKDLTGLTVWNLVKAKVTDEEILAKAAQSSISGG